VGRGMWRHVHVETVGSLAHVSAVCRRVPSAWQVVTARRYGMDSKAAQSKWWRGRFGQHCIGHYVEGVCPHVADPKGCGFLHGDDGA
jgi:hypothetical protein